MTPSPKRHGAGVATSAAQARRVAGEDGRIDTLSEDDRCVIRTRHYGWENASPGLLALVFRVSVQAINAVIAEGLCKACGRRLDVCNCPDAVAAGVVPAVREG